ncbi:hypothetical protein SAMN02745127_01948 [Oceanospirillum multiglobuliferum]|uniref:Uncharacterized protein n=1 Tax=Oceanospirillum multiglobuliferum TaxID=64969 RepID=A0A1T4QMZ7_9GAMM|nr:hypothetical protein [Oceanospirillum multiglobuliferum]OPX56451.1 hypothetical protein BTE48_03210 [Oceanospirillum multiglobuliferum]SKA05119.1 hypothetical protein SAMN02745127_01948 [Oceanospirillum multiglobuliferum]
MKMLNRSAITVKLTQAFVDWINELDEDSDQLTLAEVNEEATVYLIPEIEDEDQLNEMLEEFYLNILENELKSWEEDESLWPTTLDMALFQAFLQIDPSVMVFDLDFQNSLQAASMDDLEEAL